MQETMINIPISFLIWLIVCAVACMCMLIVQTGFVLHDIETEKKKKHQEEIDKSHEPESEDIGRTE